MERAGDVFTVYQLDVLESIKPELIKIEPDKLEPGKAGQIKTPLGSAPIRELYTELAVPGGVAGGLRQMVPGAPVLQRNKEYVLFLWTGRSGITQLMGLSQGLFSVTQSAGGQIEIVQTRATERMLDASGRAVQSSVLTLPLVELRLRVRHVLASSQAQNHAENKEASSK